MKFVRPTAIDFDLEVVSGAIRSDGYWHGSNLSSGTVAALNEVLGKVLFVTDVKVKPGSKALVTSDRPLDFHTDHHRADLILWHCIEQSDLGGESMMLDGHQLLSYLTGGQLDLLRQTMLFEHKVFPNDPEEFPMLSTSAGRDKIYYSFWLRKENFLPAQRDAINDFKRLTETTPPICILLKPGDALVMDNGRMLHGRSAILGNKKRLIKRYWIER